MPLSEQLSGGYRVPARAVAQTAALSHPARGTGSPAQPQLSCSSPAVPTPGCRSCPEPSPRKGIAVITLSTTSLSPARHSHHSTDENAHFCPPPSSAESFPGALPAGKIEPLNPVCITQSKERVFWISPVWDTSLGAVHQCSPTDVTAAEPVCTS